MLIVLFIAFIIYIFYYIDRYYIRLNIHSITLDKCYKTTRKLNIGYYPSSSIQWRYYIKSMFRTDELIQDICFNIKTGQVIINYSTTIPYNFKDIKYTYYYTKRITTMLQDVISEIKSNYPNVQYCWELNSINGHIWEDLNGYYSKPIFTELTDLNWYRENMYDGLENKWGFKLDLRNLSNFNIT